MWLLVLICTSTVVGGISLHPTQKTTSNATDNATVTSMLDMLKPATTGALNVSVVPLNDTHNVTSPVTDMVASVLEPQQNSAETLAELKGGLIVQEGDILIPEDRNAVDFVWADAIVPYTISYELAHRKFNILTAFRMISDFTCIRFRPRTTELNYIIFKTGKGCASFVGCQGGAQPVYYSRSCSVGNLCHEIIHALGLHHEQTRTDRDQYVTVLWQNIMPGKKRYFKMKHGNTLNLPYDLRSIMHYGPYFFSQNGRPTILPKQSGVHVGLRKYLSVLDVQKLNSLYHCAARTRE